MPRPPKTDPEYITRLEQRAEKARRDLQRARDAGKKQARDLDTTRCVIAGRLALNHYEKNAASDWGKFYFRLLDEYVEPRHRFLFDFLPPREESPATGSAQPDPVREAAEAMLAVPDKPFEDAAE